MLATFKSAWVRVSVSLYRLPSLGGCEREEDRWNSPGHGCTAFGCRHVICVRIEGYGREQKTRSDPGRRCRRLQPADRRGRGPHVGAAAGLAQRSHRSDDLRPQRPHRQAHRRRRDRRISQRRRRGAMRPRDFRMAWSSATPGCRKIVASTSGSAFIWATWSRRADGDLMGDGVNIAARLEGVAQPGAYALSEDAYRQVKARLVLAVTDLGPTHLKTSQNRCGPIQCRSGLPRRRSRRSQAQTPGGSPCLTDPRSRFSPSRR